MIKNYIKIALRNIVKHKGTSFINIAGLSIGIACSILILLFVTYERSYDKFHDKADRIYRLAVRAMVGDTKIRQTFSSSETLRRLRVNFPEIEAAVKFLRLRGNPVIVDNTTFYESRFYAVDSAFYDVFTIPLIQGDPKTVLTDPNTMVLSKETAEKYFGSIDVVGKVVKVDTSSFAGILDFKVTGVSENVPGNSHFQYDLLVSTATFPTVVNNTGWSSNNFITYLLLTEGTSQSWFDEKLKEFTRTNMGGERFDAWVAQGNYWEYYLQPITDIHLNSDLNGELEANGNKTYVFIFSIVSVIILLIACINFMNLSTAKSSLRAREVGLRKVVGSSRKKLVTQFISESVVLSYLSLVIGLAIVQLLLPLYRNFIGRELYMPYFDNFFVIPSLLALGLLVGILSGSYPAFFLSSFKPITVLRGGTGSSRGSAALRNFLVVFQFAISIFLITGTLVVFQQLKYFQNKRLGFDKEQVLVVRNPGALTRESVTPFKDTLRTNSHIVNVSGSSTLPGTDFNNIGFGAEGVEQNFTLNLCVCDYEFLDTLRLEMAQGRFFSKKFPTDSHGAVLNEKAAKLLGWDNPIGKKVNNWAQNRGNFTVIGVIKDYHYESLHQEIRPQALFLSGGYYANTESYIAVRLNTTNISDTVGFIGSTWNDFAPGKPFEYSFLDEDYNKLYTNEIQTRSLFSIFSFLAIFIACLGLFGLAAFVADRKTKEIGIRKILGATVPGLVNKLNKSFVKWVLLANLIAWPTAYYFMDKWLQNFAYRTNLSWWMFVLAAVIALFIALLTVSFQSVKAALKNPADTLRYE